MGTVEGTVAALVMERGGAAAWFVGWNSKLLAIVFSVNRLRMNYHFLYILWCSEICLW